MLYLVAKDSYCIFLYSCFDNISFLSLISCSIRIDLASGFALSRQELSSLMVAPAVGMSTLNYPFVILNLFLGMTGYKNITKNFAHT